MEKQNLTEKEVSEKYSIGLRLLRNMRMHGEGPTFIKISGTLGETGGRIVYPVAAVDAWLSSMPAGGGGSR